MNNKGFTLIEIIAVIAILGTIGVIFTVSLTSTLEKTNQKECDEYVSEIENAACAYAALHCNRDCNSVYISTLVDLGLFTREHDACTNKDVDKNQKVTISWSSSGEKNCHYDGVREYGR